MGPEGNIAEPHQFALMIGIAPCEWLKLVC